MNTSREANERWTLFIHLLLDQQGISFELCCFTADCASVFSLSLSIPKHSSANLKLPALHNITTYMALFL